MVLVVAAVVVDVFAAVVDDDDVEVDELEELDPQAAMAKERTTMNERAARRGRMAEGYGRL